MMDTVEDVLQKRVFNDKEAEQLYYKEKLSKALHEIKSTSEDYQQTLWQSHDTTAILEGRLKTIADVITILNPQAASEGLTEDGNNYFIPLVSIYFDNPHKHIQLLLLKLFQAAGAVANLVYEVMATNLPHLLKKPVMEDEANEDIVYESLNLLGSICLEKPLSRTELDSLDQEFILKLLQITTKYAEEKIGIAGVRVILAANTQYDAPDNVVIQSLEKSSDISYFSQCVKNLVNRADPFLQKKKPGIKMTEFLFSNPGTFNFFYSNDLNVFVDIIIRELQDLNETDKLRLEYLQLLKLILQNGDYRGDKYKKASVKEVLNVVTLMSDQIQVSLANEILEDSKVQNVLDS